MDVLRRMRGLLSGRSAETWETIVSDQAGFSVGSRRIAWSRIASVAAFKRDLVTFDEVWFQLETDQGTVMVCEEQPGFGRWETLLCTAIPAVGNWRDVVLQPAFAQNFSVLYRRRDEQGRGGV